MVFSGLLHIVGLATPYWHTITSTTTQQKDIPTGHHGLFVRCTNINDDIVDCDGHEKRGKCNLEVLCEYHLCQISNNVFFFLRDLYR